MHRWFPLTLRDAALGDIDRLLELERACYAPAHAYSREEYRYSLVRAKAVNLLMEEDGATSASEGSEDPDASAAEAALRLRADEPAGSSSAADALRIIGFVGAFHHRTQRLGHIYTVNVHPKQRGRGLGRTLMAACEERLRALGMTRVLLEVNVENADAIRLYERCGYARGDLLKDYYKSYRVNDAWLYEKPL